MNDPASVEVTVLNILSEVLDEPADDLRGHPVLAAYEWDSLRLLEALVQMESALGVTLDLRSYQAARKVDDLVNLVLATVHKKATIQR